MTVWYVRAVLTIVMTYWCVSENVLCGHYALTVKHNVPLVMTVWYVRAVLTVNTVFLL